MSGIALMEENFAVAEALIVDMDADPFVPPNWQVARDSKGIMRHVRAGRFRFDPTHLGLVSGEQVTNQKTVSIADIIQRLRGQTPSNANLADFYLENPDYIPREYVGQVIAFAGTVYLDHLGREVYRCISSSDSEGKTWHETFGWLNHKYYDKKHPLIVFIDKFQIPFC